MTRIVLGYDKTPAAQSALEWVAVRAPRDGARVELVTVTAMLTSDRARAESALESAERALRDMSPGTSVESRRIDGTMPSALLEDAAHADLLVVGVRGGGAWRAALGGGNPTRLTARAHGPVVLVPEGWTYRELPVTVGVDDDPSSDAAIEFAAREAIAAGTRLRMLHAWVMPTPVLEGSVALLASPLEVKDEHRRILKDALRRVEEAHPGLEIEPHLVPEYAGTALMRAADSSALVVIGTHRRGIFAGAVLGSVGADLVGRAACPVGVVPSGSRR